MPHIQTTCVKCKRQRFFQTLVVCSKSCPLYNVGFSRQDHLLADLPSLHGKTLVCELPTQRAMSWGYHSSFGLDCFTSYFDLRSCPSHQGAVATGLTHCCRHSPRQGSPAPFLSGNCGGQPHGPLSRCQLGGIPVAHARRPASG